MNMHIEIWIKVGATQLKSVVIGQYCAIRKEIILQNDNKLNIFNYVRMLFVCHYKIFTFTTLLLLVIGLDTVIKI